MVVMTQDNIILCISIILIFVAIYLKLNKDKTEGFKVIPYGSASGFGPQEKNPIEPLFNNFSNELGKDFELSSLIRKLKFQNIMSNNKLNPVFIIPEIGASKIYGMWNKSSTGTQTVRQIDAYGNFESKEKWSCKEIETNWVPLWINEDNSGLPLYCWQDNISIKLKEKLAVNSDGVITTTESIGSIDFEPNTLNSGLGIGGNYGTIVHGLQALGYTLGTSMFGVQYDFRKICSKDEMNFFMKSFINLIERSVSQNGKRAVLIGHGLGAVLTNYVLVNINQQWKDRYIESFVSVAGTFGGTPKALRVLLSGESLANENEQKIFRNTTMNFTGLQWMLPRPEIYGTKPLVFYKEVSYTANEIPELLQIASNMAGISDTERIYSDVVKDVAIKSLEAPNVAVYILGGANLNTESNYNYKNSLINEPVKNYPYYRVNGPFNTNADFQSDFTGDSTVPKFVLEYPISWSKTQRQVVNYKFYDQVSHNKILMKYEPVSDILELLNNYSKMS